MTRYPKLIFPPIPKSLVRRTKEGIYYVDQVRGIRLKLTPEEWVRRHVIGWLKGQRVQEVQIIQEYPVRMNGQMQRAEVVVVTPSGRPLLLVECKAADIALEQAELAQLVCYNMELQAPWIMLTNGQTFSLLQRTEQGYRTENDPPCDWLSDQK